MALTSAILRPVEQALAEYLYPLAGLPEDVQQLRGRRALGQSETLPDGTTRHITLAPPFVVIVAGTSTPHSNGSTETCNLVFKVQCLIKIVTPAREMTLRNETMHGDDYHDFVVAAVKDLFWDRQFVSKINTTAARLCVFGRVDLPAESITPSDNALMTQLTFEVEAGPVP